MTAPLRYNWADDSICRTIVAHVASLPTKRATVAAFVVFAPYAGTEVYREAAKAAGAEFASQLTAYLGSHYLVVSFALDDAPEALEEIVGHLASTPWHAGAVFTRRNFFSEILQQERTILVDTTG